MIDMLSKYDNMHKNWIFYALIFINNHIITYLNWMLSDKIIIFEDFIPYPIYDVLEIS